MDETLPGYFSLLWPDAFAEFPCAACGAALLSFFASPAAHCITRGIANLVCVLEGVHLEPEIRGHLKSHLFGSPLSAGSREIATLLGGYAAPVWTETNASGRFGFVGAHLAESRASVWLPIVCALLPASRIGA